VVLGIWATVGVNVFGPGHDYRSTVAVWYRGLFLLRPDTSLMAGAPPLFQLHTLAALALVAIWPFTRLVHTWAVPITVFRTPTRPANRPTPAAGSFPVR
jgi:nitrate reductase gamma subunit